MDAGEIFSAVVISKREYFGLPFVIASRLCENRALYEQGESDVLVTGHAVNVGAESRFWGATDFRKVQSGVNIAGLSQKFDVFGPG